MCTCRCIKTRDYFSSSLHPLFLRSFLLLLTTAILLMFHACLLHGGLPHFSAQDNPTSIANRRSLAYSCLVIIGCGQEHAVDDLGKGCWVDTSKRDTFEQECYADADTVKLLPHLLPHLEDAWCPSLTMYMFSHCITREILVVSHRSSQGSNKISTFVVL